MVKKKKRKKRSALRHARCKSDERQSTAKMCWDDEDDPQQRKSSNERATRRKRETKTLTKIIRHEQLTPPAPDQRMWYSLLSVSWQSSPTKSTLTWISRSRCRSKRPTTWRTLNESSGHERAARQIRRMVKAGIRTECFGVINSQCQRTIKD